MATRKADINYKSIKTETEIDKPQLRTWESKKQEKLNNPGGLFFLSLYSFLRQGFQASGPNSKCIELPCVAVYPCHNKLSAKTHSMTFYTDSNQFSTIFDKSFQLTSIDLGRWASLAFRSANRVYGSVDIDGDWCCIWFSFFQWHVSLWANFFQLYNLYRSFSMPFPAFISISTLISSSCGALLGCYCSLENFFLFSSRRIDDLQEASEIGQPARHPKNLSFAMMQWSRPRARSAIV